jgi:tetratricopeptide (TPR) repeat protein
MMAAHTTIGDIHRHQGRYDQAADAYEQACRLEPYAFRPHYDLGVTYQFLAGAAKTAKAAGEYLRKAVSVYVRAVTLRPHDFDTNLNLSACYFQQGKYALAEEYCMAAIRINGHSPFAYSNLGIIYSAQNRPEDAIRAYNQSLEIDMHQPKLLLNLGSTNMRLGRFKKAIRFFELSAEQDPSSAAPWVHIGTCHYHQRSWPQALAAYENAIQIDPGSAAGWRGVGVVHMTQFVVDRQNTHLHDEALQAWGRSLRLDPNQPDLIRLVEKYTARPSVPAL